MLAILPFFMMTTFLFTMVWIFSCGSAANIVQLLVALVLSMLVLVSGGVVVIFVVALVMVCGDGIQLLEFSMAVVTLASLMVVMLVDVCDNGVDDDNTWLYL